MNSNVLRLADVPAYHPANHTGTTNRRLIAPETVGARQLELLHGTIEPGEGASLHAHPGIEQVCWVLDGEAEVEIGEERARIGPGDCCFFPAGMMHKLQVVGERPLKVLVIYAPPYGEDPAKVLRG
jgi:mannose-6-phosphate isomerase-like protein (cupin superfamily)